MSFRTPLSKVRGLGSAKSGVDHWWSQRITAIANIPLVIFFVIFVVLHIGATHAEITASLAHPLVAIAFAAFLFSLLWHMRLGMQVIIEDYIHGESIKIGLLLLNSFFTFALGLASAYAILKISLGG